MADIEPQPARIDHQLGQRRDVAHAEIEALAGDRMNDMRRLADQGQARGGGACRVKEGELIGPAPPLDLERAEMIAEAAPELGQEPGLVEREQRGREGAPLGPHDRRALPGHRQDGERPGGQEMLDRDAAVRLGVAHGADDAGLRIGPGHARDAGGLAQRRALPVGRGDELRADAASVGEGGDGAVAILDRAHLHRRDISEARQAREPGEERAAQHPVLDDEAQRMIADERMVVMEKERRAAIGDADLANGLGIGGEIGPQAQGREDLPGRPGERGGAAVERRVEHPRRRLAVDQRGLDAGARRGEGERHAGEAAADDQKLDPQIVHVPTMAGSGPRCPGGEIRRFRLSRTSHD